jgi:Putative peptidoglycan binding domain
MRTFLVLICSFALACAAVGAQKTDKSKKAKKKQAQSTQRAAPETRPGRSGPQKTTARRASGPNSARGGSTADYQKKTKGSRPVTTAGERPRGAQAAQGTKQKTKGSQRGVAYQRQGADQDVQKAKKSKVSRTSGRAFQTSSKTHKARHINLQTNVRPTRVKGITFQQNRRIVGSQHWHGPSYTVFRTYTPVWHDRVWWTSHYPRIAFVFGGWYYWNAGWWYPAWGYAPNAYYAYDGPIYAYNDLPPDQVIANVQVALQQQGYYEGEVDGLLGPLTRAALADYQRDYGLYETAAIDQPTLESLGMT